jgi:WD40 repeat protein
MFTCAFALLMDLSVCLPLLQPGTDGHGDRLPPGALVRFGTTTRFGHFDPIRWVGFAPDGQTVITAGSERHLRFWDVATRKESASYPNWSVPRYSFNLSADGRKLALANFRDETMKILDIVSRKEIRRLTFDELFGPEGERFGNDRFVLSPNGQLLAIWDDLPPNCFVPEEQKKRRRFSLDVWDLDSGRRIRTWKTGDLREAEFSPDGNTLVTQARSPENKGSSLRLWEIGSGKELRRVELPRALARFVFLPNGKTILGLSMDRKALHLFDSATGKEHRAIAGNGEPIMTFALSLDGKTLALVQEGRLIVQGLDNGKTVLNVPFSGDLSVLFERHRYDPIVDLAAFSPDGKTLAVANGRQLALWNLATGARLHPDDSMGGPVLAVHTHGHNLLARDMDMDLSLWDLRTGKLQRRFSKAHHQRPQERRYDAACELLHWGGGFQAISPDGLKVAAFWHDGPIHLFDLASGQRLHLFEGSEPATCLAFSPDGKFLAGPTDDGRIRLWDTRTGKPIQDLLPPFKRDSQPTFLALRFAPDGRTLAASAWSGSCDVLIWELASGNLRSSRHAETRDARSGNNVGDLGHLEFFENLTMSFLYTPDAKHLAAAGPRAIRLWDAGTDKEVRRFGGRQVAGQSAVFSPDGKLLAAGLDDGGIRFWDAISGAVLRDVPAHGAMVTSLSFADAGKTLVSGSLDGTAIAWDLNRLLKDPPADTTELDKLWASLGQADGEKASQTMQALTARPKETLALFKARLRPVPAVAPDRLTQLLADLQSNQYVVRQRATAELEQLDLQARPALEKALDAQPAVEARRRIEALLKKLEPPFSAPDRLRSIRAVEVLERIGSRDARLFLETLAAGGRGHRLTEDARAALDRLSKRP